MLINPYIFIFILLVMQESG